MLTLPLPPLINGPLLEEELATGGLVTDVYIACDSLLLVDLVESDAAAAQAVVAAHGSTARAALTQRDDTYAKLAAPVNNFTGKIEVDGGFTNALDSDLWVAGPIRNNPTNDTNAIYAQHRVMGDLGGEVHDGIGAEVRVTSGTNATAVCGLETTAQIGGADNLIADMRSVTSNFVIQPDAGGSITNASVLRAQTIPALPTGFTIDTVYGLYVENQTVGGTNYSIYAPTGLSVFGNLTVDSLAKVKGRLDLIGVPLLVRNSGDTGTFFSIGPAGPRWNDASLERTTVGAAGDAAALPSAPLKYLRVQDSAGANVLIPCYTYA